MPIETHTRIAEKDLRDAADRALAAPQLQASDRLRRFLGYVIDETLAGREGQLKGYSVGVEVFDKPCDFNPEADSGVRVEAVRLRRALQTYYLTDGKDDPIHIDIPKGGYVPFFHRQEPPPEETMPSIGNMSQKKLWVNRLVAAWVGAVLGLAVYIATVEIISRS